MLVAPNGSVRGLVSSGVVPTRHGCTHVRCAQTVAQSAPPHPSGVPCSIVPGRPGRRSTVCVLTAGGRAVSGRCRASRNARGAPNAKVSRRENRKVFIRNNLRQTDRRKNRVRRGEQKCSFWTLMNTGSVQDTDRAIASGDAPRTALAAALRWPTGPRLLRPALPTPTGAATRNGQSARRRSCGWHRVAARSWRCSSRLPAGRTATNRDRACG